LLLAKGKLVVHHGVMNHFDDAELGRKLLPGVDLTLWMQLVLAVLLVVAIAGVSLALR
jgi:hypothetical protein